jgi:hypothetical protein
MKLKKIKYAGNYFFGSKTDKDADTYLGEVSCKLGHHLPISKTSGVLQSFYLLLSL